MKGIVEHFKQETFEQNYWIPAHNKRRESALFRSNKEFIRDKCGVPCWVCGSQTDLEVHHVFEWAFWNALDPRKVTNILAAIEFYDDDYVQKAQDSQTLREFLDKLIRKKPILDSPDDARNLVVLCREHHRLKNTGIHTLTFPIWLSMSAIATEGENVLSKEQVLLAAERVRKIDEELASLAENNYQPHR